MQYLSIDVLEYHSSQIGPLLVTKFHSTINGIPVIGCDTTVHFSMDSQNYSIHYQSINTYNALSLVQTHEFTFPPPSDSLATKVYYVDHTQAIIPAWKIQFYKSHLHDQKITYMDARNGRILSTLSTRIHDRGYVFPPNTQPSIGSKPPLTDLLNVLDSPTGYSIRGKDFKSFNTCFAYKCFGNVNASDCDLDSSICVDPSSSEVEGRDYYTVKSNFTLDGRNIDYKRDWVSQGYPNRTLYMQWVKSPVFAPRIKKPQDGIWGSDINFQSYSASSQTDTLDELQVYHWMTLHLEFLKNLLNDRNFCLLGMGENCALKDPRTNRTATKIDYPMPFVVNYQSMKVYPDDSNSPDFMAQIALGKGKSREDPIKFYGFEDYPDAFFTYSSFQPELNGTFFPDCLDGKCVSIQDSPLDFFAFGQSQESDWSLNNCIVFHELNHALVMKYIPDLPSYKWTNQGLASDPGALNEGWADYFAAIHCQLSDFTKTYNGRPRRNLNNQYTCADLVGEVHQDAQIFTGALWEIRNYQTNSEHQVSFDKIVLTALSLGDSSSDFESQSKLILDLLSRNSLLSYCVPFATLVFKKRILDCVRTTIYKETMDSTFRLPSALSTSANVSTMPTQLRIIPRASDWGFQLKWKQWHVNPIMGPLKSGYGILPLSVAFNLDCPIQIQSINSSYNAINSCNASDTLAWVSTQYISTGSIGDVQYSHGIYSSPVYIYISHQYPAEMVMYSTNLILFGFNRIWLLTLVVIGCIQAIPWLLLVICIAFYYLIKAIKSWRKYQVTQVNQEESIELVTDPPKLIEWKTIFDLHPSFTFRRSLLTHFTLTTLFIGASATVCIVGLLYSPFMAYVFWLGFIPIPIIFLMDLGEFFYILNQKKFKQNRLNGLFKFNLILFIIMSFLWLSTSMGALALSLNSGSGLASHVFCYFFFILSYFARLVTFLWIFITFWNCKSVF